MTTEEIAKLLELDKRDGRIAPPDGKLSRLYLFEVYATSRAETAAVKAALRRYIEIMESPDEMKWCFAALREIDQIRAVAGLPPKLGAHR